MHICTLSSGAFWSIFATLISDTTVYSEKVEQPVKEKLKSYKHSAYQANQDQFLNSLACMTLHYSSRCLGCEIGEVTTIKQSSTVSSYFLIIALLFSLLIICTDPGDLELSGQGSWERHKK